MKAITKNISQGAFQGIETKRELRKKIVKELIDCLGNFCSYCENPLAGYQVVHQKNFAAWKPNFEVEDWDNLLLICKDCRDHIIKPELSSAEHEKLFWPDEDLTFSMKKVAPFSYVPRKISYRVVESHKKTEKTDLELVFVVPNPLATKHVQLKAQRTIDHFQLNMRTEYLSRDGLVLRVPEPDHLQVLDNRIFERTKTWKKANEAAERYRLMRDTLSPLKRQDIVDSFKQQITSNAFFRGNWSVWMTVFWNHFQDHRLLEELFIKDTHFFGKVK